MLLFLQVLPIEIELQLMKTTNLNLLLEQLIVKLLFVWYLEIGFICQQIINPQATTSLQQKSHSQKRSQICQEIFG